MWLIPTAAKPANSTGILVGDHSEIAQYVLIDGLECRTSKIPPAAGQRAIAIGKDGLMYHQISHCWQKMPQACHHCGGTGREA